MRLAPEKIEIIRSTLDSVLQRPWDNHAMDKDPVGLIHNYTNSLSIEIAGLITSCFSYGRQSAFRPLIEKVLSQMGPSPVAFLDSSEKNWRTDFDWFTYRFNCADDLVSLFTSMKKLLDNYGTIEKAFSFDQISDVQMAIGLFVDRMCGQDSTKSFSYLLPHPAKGSACKRLNMFIRWMCRHDKIDVGIWKSLHTSKLVIPLDTHVSRISKNLGLTVKNGNGWKVAEDITDSLRQLDPIDPLKYDFAICNAGVLGIL